LADYVHSKGLLFGVYTDRGNMTCGARPGAQGYESIDAQTYADWGVDYLKEDSCYASQDHEMAFHEYATMRDALNATGRPIFFSLCGWYDWYAPMGASLGNSWRTGQDDTTWAGVLVNIDVMSSKGLAKYAGPGGINDPCMLLSSDYTGQPAMTENQTRAQFGQWAIVSTSCFCGSDTRKASQDF
jgi:alpha-galactosidase